MIVIISDDNDNSTNEVIDWLIFLKKKYYRINRETSIDLSRFSLSNSLLSVKVNGMDIGCLDGFWYRRGNIVVKNPPIKLLDNQFNEQLKSHLVSEKKQVSYCVYKYLRDKAKNKIGDFYTTINLNKQEVLSKAKKVGLKIPDTIITSEKKVLIEFSKEHKKIITKAIGDVESFHLKGDGYIYTYTNLINQINDIPECFFPSLFQKAIDKKYELRIFFLNSKFYSMAIFSQLDSQTEVDFRNYNNTIPNRYVPFKLNFQIEIRLKRLMKLLKLETGSIDMIIDEKDNYYFLEVNPVGQYGMVDKACNYNLSKKIAVALCK